MFNGIKSLNRQNKWLPILFVGVAIAVLGTAIWQLFFNKPVDEVGGEVNQNNPAFKPTNEPTWTANAGSKLVAPVIPLSIRNDSSGSGHYESSRGSRSHGGVDFLVQKGQVVMSPIAGIVTRKAFPYAKDLKWEGVYIKGEDFDVKIFYMTPLSNIVGKTVKMGEHVGEAQAISQKYGGSMKNHIHVEVWKNGKNINSEEIFNNLIIA